MDEKIDTLSSGKMEQDDYMREIFESLQTLSPLPIDMNFGNDRIPIPVLRFAKRRTDNADGVKDNPLPLWMTI